MTEDDPSARKVSWLNSWILKSDLGAESSESSSEFVSSDEELEAA